MILKLGHKIPLEDVLDRIEYADSTEIDAMIQAIRNRYSRLFPDWEILLFSIHTGSEADRRRDVEALIDFLRQKYLH